MYNDEIKELKERVTSRVSSLINENRVEEILCMDYQINRLNLSPENKAVIKHLVVMQMHSSNNDIGSIKLVGELSKEEASVVKQYIKAMCTDARLYDSISIVPSVNTTGVLSLYYKDSKQVIVLSSVIAELEELECTSIDVCNGAQGLGKTIHSEELERIYDNYGSRYSLRTYFYTTL